MRRFGSNQQFLPHCTQLMIGRAIAGVGDALSGIMPNKRPFDVTDPDISFPYVSEEKISTGLLVVLGLVVPAVNVFVTALFLGLGPVTSQSGSRGASCVASSTVAFILTSGTTLNAIGRPRPDLTKRPRVINITSILYLKP